MSHNYSDQWVFIPLGLYIPFKSLVKSKKQCICSYILFTSVSLNKENGQHSTTSDLQKQNFLMVQPNAHQPSRSPSSPAFWKDVCTIPSVFTTWISHEKEVLKMKVCVWRQNIAFTAGHHFAFFSVRFDNWDPTLCQLWPCCHQEQEDE